MYDLTTIHSNLDGGWTSSPFYNLRKLRLRDGKLANARKLQRNVAGVWIRDHPALYPKPRYLYFNIIWVFVGLILRCSQHFLLESQKHFIDNDVSYLGECQSYTKIQNYTYLLLSATQKGIRVDAYVFLNDLESERKWWSTIRGSSSSSTFS